MATSTNIHNPVTAIAYQHVGEVRDGKAGWVRMTDASGNYVAIHMPWEQCVAIERAFRISRDVATYAEGIEV